MCLGWYYWGYYVVERVLLDDYWAISRVSGVVTGLLLGVIERILRCCYRVTRWLLGCLGLQSL